jgi:hypothetical protein
MRPALDFLREQRPISRSLAPRGFASIRRLRGGVGMRMRATKTGPGAQQAIVTSGA